MYQSFVILVFSIFALPIACFPQNQASRDLSHQAARDTASPLVFAHYMLLTRPPNGDYTNDIKLAADAGIDAFALNYGGWNVDFTVQDGYLSEFYSAAAKLGFKVFLSIDTTSVKDSNKVVQLANLYKDSPAQLTIAGRMVLSTFQVDPPAWNWQTDVLDQIGTQVMFLPGSLSDDAGSLFAQTPGDGFFPWIHPTKTVSQEADTDSSYAAQRDATGKIWMAGVASWFFKRFDANNNWSHAQDDGIFIDRWLHLLQLKPNYIEIITWNDWGESHYIGPADTTNTSPQSSWDTLDHSAFLKMTKVFIKAYKAGQTTISIEAGQEDVFMFYRLQPARRMGSTDSLPLPLDAEYLKDEVFVVSFLASGADIILTSGGTVHHIAGSAGVSKTGIPWTLGSQSLSASRSGQTLVTKTGPSISQQLDRYNGNVVAL
ncbi:MAG: hypothetical protein M1812_002741 [Candelaria pacifica]|nr:MAG: hypothetical protein M1812_002741 [Candelaria pacifica]